MNAPTSRLSRTTLHEVRAAVRAAMARECGLPADPARVGASADDAFVRAVRRHRVAQALGPVAGDGFSDAVRDAIRGQNDCERLAALHGIPALFEAVGSLQAAGIRVLVIKGMPLAVQTTGDPLARGSGDIDLFCGPDDIPAAWKIMADLGYRQRPAAMPLPRESDPRWSYARWVGYEIPLDRAGASIDLHWRLSADEGSLPSFGEAWQRRQPVAISGQSVCTLAVIDALAHSCAHATKDHWGWLRSLVDIHRLLRLSDDVTSVLSWVNPVSAFGLGT